MFRSIIAAFLSLSLVVLSPGLAGYQAAAQVVNSGARVPVEPIGGVGAALGGPRVLGIEGVSVSLTPAQVEAMSPIPTIAPFVAAPTPAQAVQALAQELAPELKAVENVGSAAAEAAPGLGHRMFDVILRRKSIPAAGDTLAAPVAVSSRKSRLAKAPRYPGDAAIKAQKLTETTFVVFDTEISSFFSYAEISKFTDVGAVKFRVKPDGTREILGVFSQAVDPQVPLDIRITQMNGTTPGDLKGRPTVDQVLPKFLEFVGTDSVLIAHNAPFDVSFMGYQLKELGLAMLPNLVIDTKDITAKVFPGLKSYSVLPLIKHFGLGATEDHMGASDSHYESMIFIKDAQKLAEDRKGSLADLTVGDVAALSDNLHFETIFERMAPKEVAPADRKPMPENFAEESRRVNNEVLHKNRLPNMLRDLAYAMGLPYETVKAKLRQAHQNVAVSKADEVFEDLTKNPPSAVVMDYDGTMTPLSPAFIAKLLALLKTGLPVAFMTGRSLDYQLPSGSKISMDLWEPLISKIPEAYRANLFFSGRVGGELATFDAKGQVVRYLEGDWTPAEKAKYAAAIEAARLQLGIAKEDMTLVETPGQPNVVFKEGDARAGAFAKLLVEKFKEAGFLVPVLHNKEWVYFSKFDKGDGIRLLYTAMKAKGLDVAPETMVFFGDEFRTPADAPAGGDSAGALAFPKMRSVSVGDSPTDVLPSNVRWLGIKGALGTGRLIDAVMKGLAQKPAPAAPAVKFEWAKAVKVLAIFGLGALTPLLITHAAFAAVAGSIVLSVIGLPQIWTNFRKGGEATKYQAIGGSMNWFGAAALLTVTSILNHSPLQWVLANVAGLVESAIVVAQIRKTSTNPSMPKSWKKGLIVLGSAGLVYGALNFFLAPATASFAVAVAFLYMLPFPQIMENHGLWQREKRIPDGVNPAYPGLVLLGSLLHLIAAVTFGDILWILNASIASFTSSIILSQIYAPALANPVLTPLIKLLYKIGGLFSRSKGEEPAPAPEQPAPQPQKPEPAKPAPYQPKTQAQLNEEAFTLQKTLADGGNSPYSMINVARSYERGVGVPKDGVKAYVYYGLAESIQEIRAGYDGMRDVEKTLTAEQLAQAQSEILARLGRAAAGAGVKTAAFRRLLRAQDKPRVMLSGAWGFPDFDANKPAYGEYVQRTKDVAFRRGYEMLKLVQQDVKKAGFATINPWIVNLPDIYIDGVMFGAGPGVDGKPWAEGSLAAKTMPKERLLEWIKMIAPSYGVNQVKYRYSADSSYEHLEQVYRNMVGDVIYFANVRSVNSADIVFVNLNAYRGGDADDGTLWELVKSVDAGKEVIVLVDETPEAALNEGIFGAKNRWNIMVSGFLEQQKKKVKIFHRMSDALKELGRHRPAPEAPLSMNFAPLGYIEGLAQAAAYAQALPC